MRRKPDFFFLGAPNCGTTALAAYLAEHPLIQISDPKEPHYFCSDLKAGGIPVSSDDEYIASFFPCLNESNVVAAGDASVWYLYSKVAVKNIIKFCPDAKFIVLLRNPVSMACSLHSMLVFQGQEDEVEIIKAWKFQEKRKKGLHIPKGLWLDTAMLQYKAVCSLGTQLECVYHAVDRGRVHVVFQEELFKNTVGTYSGVLYFIGVPNDERTSFPKINAGRKLNNRYLVNMLRSRAALKSAAVIKSIFRLKTLGIGRPDLAISQEVAAFLSVEFEDEVRKLERLLNKDLSAWRKK